MHGAPARPGARREARRAVAPAYACCRGAKQPPPVPRPRGRSRSARMLASAPSPSTTPAPDGGVAGRCGDLVSSVTRQSAPRHSSTLISGSWGLVAQEHRPEGRYSVERREVDSCRRRGRSGNHRPVAACLSSSTRMQRRASRAASGSPVTRAASCASSALDTSARVLCWSSSTWPGRAAFGAAPACMPRPWTTIDARTTAAPRPGRRRARPKPPSPRRGQAPAQARRPRCAPRRAPHRRDRSAPALPAGPQSTRAPANLDRSGWGRDDWRDGEDPIEIRIVHTHVGAQAEELELQPSEAEGAGQSQPAPPRQRQRPARRARAAAKASYRRAMPARCRVTERARGRHGISRSAPVVVRRTIQSPSTAKPSRTCPDGEK